MGEPACAGLRNRRQPLQLWHGMDFMQGGIGDDIQVSLHVEAIKQ